MAARPQFEGLESWPRIEIKEIFGLDEAGGGRVSPGLPVSEKTALRRKIASIDKTLPLGAFSHSKMPLDI